MLPRSRALAWKGCTLALALTALRPVAPIPKRPSANVCSVQVGLRAAVLLPAAGRSGGPEPPGSLLGGAAAAVAGSAGSEERKGKDDAKPSDQNLLGPCHLLNRLLCTLHEHRSLLAKHESEAPER